VAEPSLAAAAALLAANRQRLTAPAPDILGRSWADLRRQARQVAVAAASDYLATFFEPLPSFGNASILMAGHQPELFHPGVWVKNFALNGLARARGATPINLVVDNDTAKSTALRLPVLNPAAVDGEPPPLVRVETAPFDHWAGEVPYEERAVHDEGLFASLPDQIAPLLNAWGFEPLLGTFWAEVCRPAARASLLGERLVRARRILERRWGCHNLELPVSRLCRTEPFAWFACHLLAHVGRFHALYNDCVHDYRRRYGLRSRNHPVPDLATEGDWREVPFWAWRAGQSQRRRLLVRHTKTALELRAGPETWPALPLPAGDATGLVRAWQDLERRGFKVRSRALTNTLFARFFVADLFMHGIGGGKYDELTDAIARRFYAIEPPGYLVLSATLLLPLPGFAVRPADCRQAAHRLRDVHYNPQRHLDEQAREVPAVRDLMAEKQSWITRQPATAAERQERFQVLRSLTNRLRWPLAPREATLRQELARCEREQQANTILRRRDYAFCLYPEALLKPFCTQFLQANLYKE
jgi:hypothetical protein